MFALNSVVPWGRNYEEYCRMFALSAGDLRGRIVGCADGPASFNAEATALGHRVVSCDPLYRFTTEEIRARIAETAPDVIEATRRDAGQYVWDRYGSVEGLERVRFAAMNRFLEDFAAGRSQSRYVDASLPSLPFGDGAFDLAVCSHFLFLYSRQFDAAFHLASIVEMARIAGEVRVFPLLALGGARSPHLDGVVEALRADGHRVAVDPVPYEFERGGNQMLRVWQPA